LTKGPGQPPGFFIASKKTLLSLFLKKIIQLYPGSEPLSEELSIA
jgi:hypothetical protein